jgi:hypothetical protein
MTMPASLAAVQIRLNLVDLIQQGVDPSAGGGVAGAIGSFYLRSGIGQAWLKTGAGAAAWTQLQQSKTFQTHSRPMRSGSVSAGSQIPHVSVTGLTMCHVTSECLQASRSAALGYGGVFG